jgi:hypothetical protein
MAITYEENSAIFTSLIYEDEVVPLRDFLQNAAPNEIKFNFVSCEDIHLAVLQLIMAYQKSYRCSYEFSNEVKLFEKVLNGFNATGDYCA